MRRGEQVGVNEIAVSVAKDRMESGAEHMVCNRLIHLRLHAIMVAAKAAASAIAFAIVSSGEKSMRPT
jgi:hypothetical protein